MQYPLENISVLDRFEKLTEQNKNPALAVYRGRNLIITSYESDSCLEKIFQAIKNVWYAILTFMGALDERDDEINKIKTEMNRYMCLKAERSVDPHIQKLKKELTELTFQKDGLNAQIKELNTKENSLFAQRTQLLKELNQIGASLSSAQEVLKSADRAAVTVENLKVEKARLEQDIVQNRNIIERQGPAILEVERLKHEIAGLQVELSKVRSDLRQANYKTQNENLARRNEELTRQLEQEKARTRQAISRLALSGKIY